MFGVLRCEMEVLDDVPAGGICHGGKPVVVNLARNCEEQKGACAQLVPAVYAA